MTTKNLHLLPSSFVQPSFGLWARACLSTQLSRGSSSSCDQKKGKKRRRSALSTVCTVDGVACLCSQLPGHPRESPLGGEKDFIFKSDRRKLGGTFLSHWGAEEDSLNAAPHTGRTGVHDRAGGAVRRRSTCAATAMGRLLCGQGPLRGRGRGRGRGGGRSRRERGAACAPGATGRADCADGADRLPAPADAGEATAAQKSKKPRSIAFAKMPLSYRRTRGDEAIATHLYHAFRGTNVCTFVPRISSAPFFWGVIASFCRVYTSSSAGTFLRSNQNMQSSTLPHMWALTQLFW